MTRMQLYTLVAGHRMIALLLGIILISPSGASDSYAATDSGKLEKTELVLAYPQASGVFA